MDQLRRQINLIVFMKYGDLTYFKKFFLSQINFDEYLIYSQLGSERKFLEEKMDGLFKIFMKKHPFKFLFDTIKMDIFR